MSDLFDELDPPPRTLMGPGPIDAEPRVLRAMSMPLLGQFDPAFTRYMNEVMSLYRDVFVTHNQWTFLIDGTARAAIETVLASVLVPGERVLVPVFGRFGYLLCEIARRVGAELIVLEKEWGHVFEADEIIAAIRAHNPKLVAIVHGDTSTTMAQPLAEIGAFCAERDTLLYCDATATLAGTPLPTDEWHIDAVTAGLQKCLGGPSGSAPITISPRLAKRVESRKHIEQGIRPDDYKASPGEIIRSNYFDLAMLMDYWSEGRLNHHTEATSMLYAARECARIVLKEGLEPRFARHNLASKALVTGLSAMGLELFGDLEHKMPNVTGVMIPSGVDGDAVRSRMLHDFGFEIGTSFGPLHGRVWRIGTMGYSCRKDNVLNCLGALEACLRRQGFKAPAGDAVDAALEVYDDG